MQPKYNLTNIDEILNQIIVHEGETVVEDDAGRGVSKFGITKDFHPDLTEDQIRNMSKEQAIQIYKDKYVSPLNVDTLPDNMKYMAIDSAINHGVGKTKQFLSKANGNPAELLKQRINLYNNLMSKPRVINGKTIDYTKYKEGWGNRLGYDFNTGQITDPSLQSIIGNTTIDITPKQQTFVVDNGTPKKVKPTTMDDIFSNGDNPFTYVYNGGKEAVREYINKNNETMKKRRQEYASSFNIGDVVNTQQIIDTAITESNTKQEKPMDWTSRNVNQLNFDLVNVEPKKEFTSEDIAAPESLSAGEGFIQGTLTGITSSIINANSRIFNKGINQADPNFNQDKKVKIISEYPTLSELRMTEREVAKLMSETNEVDFRYNIAEFLNRKTTEARIAQAHKETGYTLAFFAGAMLGDPIDAAAMGGLGLVGKGLRLSHTANAVYGGIYGVGSELTRQNLNNTEVSATDLLISGALYSGANVLQNLAYVPISTKNLEETTKRLTKERNSIQQRIKSENPDITTEELLKKTGEEFDDFLNKNDLQNYLKFNIETDEIQLIDNTEGKEFVNFKVKEIESQNLRKAFDEADKKFVEKVAEVKPLNNLLEKVKQRVSLLPEKVAEIRQALNKAFPERIEIENARQRAYDDYVAKVPDNVRGQNLKSASVKIKPRDMPKTYFNKIGVDFNNELDKAAYALATLPDSKTINLINSLTKQGVDVNNLTKYGYEVVKPAVKGRYNAIQKGKIKTDRILMKDSYLESVAKVKIANKTFKEFNIKKGLPPVTPRDPSWIDTDELQDFEKLMEVKNKELDELSVKREEARKISEEKGYESLLTNKSALASSSPAQNAQVEYTLRRLENIVKTIGLDMDRVYNWVETVKSKVSPELVESFTSMLKGNDASKAFALVALESSFGAGGRRTTAALERDKLLRIFKSDTQLMTNEVYEMWLKKVKSKNPLAMFDSNLRREFSNEFYSWMHANKVARDDGLPMIIHPTMQDEFMALAMKINSSTSKIRESFKALKLPGWENMGESSLFYLPFFNDSSRFKKVILDNPESEDIANGFLENFKEQISPLFSDNLDFKQEIIDKVSRKFFDAQKTKALGGTPASPVTMIGTDGPSEVKTAIEELVKDGAFKDKPEIEKYLFDKINSSAFTDRTIKGQFKNTKSRLERDVNAVFYTDKNGKEYRFMDVMETDLDIILNNYFTAAAGQIALGKFGIRGKEGLDQIRKAMLTPDKNGVVSNNEALDSFDFVASQFLGYRYKNRQPSILGNTLSSLTRLNTLGSAVFSQAAEIMNIGFTHGFVNVLKSLPEFPRMIGEMKRAARGEFKEGDKFVNFIKTFGLVGGDGYMQGMTSARLMEGQEIYDGQMIDWFSNTVRNLETIQYTYSGQRDVQAIGERLAYEKNLSEMFYAAQTGKISNDLVDIGLTPELAEAIMKEKNAMKFDADGNIIDFYPEKVVNPKTLNDFQIAATRGVYQQIQRNVIGETGSWVTNPWAQALLTLRSFPLNALTKQLTRGVYVSKDAFNFAFRTAGLAVMITPFIIARTIALNWQDEEKLEEALQPEKIALSTVSYVSKLGLMPDAINLTSQALFQVSPHTDKPITVPDTIMSAFPVLGATGRALALPGNMYEFGVNAASGEDVKTSDLNGLPFYNHPVLRWTLNAWVEELNDDN